MMSNQIQVLDYKMARGGRHYGRGRRGGRHSSHPLYGRDANGAGIFQVVMDTIAARTAQAVLLQDTLYLSGSSQNIIGQLDNFSAIQPTQYVDPYGMDPMAGMDMTGAGMGNNYPMQQMQPQPDLSPNPFNTNEPLLQSFPGQMVPMQQMVATPNGMQVPPPPQAAPQPTVTAVTMQNYFPKVDITAVGNKTSDYNFLCHCITIGIASILIFPMCFMCCMWWKKIVYPKYEINIQFYRAIGRFLRTNAVTHLTLNICDNGFDSAKARVLYQSLQGTPLQQFTFMNQALACNYSNSQADDFVLNMSAIKNLGMTSSMTWGDMRL